MAKDRGGRRPEQVESGLVAGENLLPPPGGAATFGPRACGAGDRLGRFRRPQDMDDASLLALLVPGSAARAAAAARGLLREHGGLARLSRCPPACLRRRDGIGPAAAARILAAFEIGRRCRAARRAATLRVREPEDVIPLLAERLHGRDREHFVAVYLDARHRVIDVETVAVGCLTASLVHPREVFRGAVQRAAAAVLVAHNHPSGDPSPSGEDRRLTARLDGCGRLLGIALVDHIVYGDDGWVSLRREGWPAAATEDRRHLAGRAGP